PATALSIGNIATVSPTNPAANIASRYVNNVLAACTLSCGMGVCARSFDAHATPSHITTTWRFIDVEFMPPELASCEPASTTRRRSDLRQAHFNTHDTTMTNGLGKINPVNRVQSPP